MTKSRVAQLRFAIGFEGGIRSSIWTLFVNAKCGDIYLGPRSEMGRLKISLHASGVCHAAWTERYYNRLSPSGLITGSRIFTAWRSPQVSPGVWRPVQIVFPGSDLRMPIVQPEKRKPVRYFAPAPNGYTSEIFILITEPSMRPEIPAGSQCDVVFQTSAGPLGKLLIIHRYQVLTDFVLGLIHEARQRSRIGPNLRMNPESPRERDDRAQVLFSEPDGSRTIVEINLPRAAV